MIPKIIHYCWFGKGLMPASHQAYIKGWKKLLPDYEIKRWDESNFDISFNDYLRNAYRNKKFAFVSDYVRLKVLYTEGGFYLDTDVELLKSLNPYRTYNLISAIAYFEESKQFEHLLNDSYLPKDKDTLIPCLGIMSAAMGVQIGNLFIKELIDFYDNINSDDKYFDGIVLDQLMAIKAIKYGFVFKNIQQNLINNQLLLPSELFNNTIVEKSSSSILIHHCAQSWQKKDFHQRFHIFLDKFHMLEFYRRFKTYIRP